MRRVFVGLLLVSCGAATDLGEPLVEDGAVPADGSPHDGIAPQDVSVVDVVLPDASTPPIDAGMMGAPIQCGMTTCNSANQVCCLEFMSMMVNPTCTSPTACMGIPLACSSALDCPMGEVCCGSFGGMGGMAGSKCQPMCMGGFNNPQLCASSAECPPGRMCQPTPFGYKVCR